MNNPFKVYEGMLVFTVSEGIVRDMQKRAAAAGIRSVHIGIDGFGSGVSVAEFSYVDEVTSLASMSRPPENQLASASISCLADAFNAVGEEIRKRNLVHADPRRLAVLNDGVAFGIEANAIEVAWAFARAVHRVSSPVSHAVAAAAKDAWSGSMKDASGMGPWRNGQARCGSAHSCLRSRSART